MQQKYSFASTTTRAGKAIAGVFAIKLDLGQTTAPIRASLSVLFFFFFFFQVSKTNLLKSYQKEILQSTNTFQQYLEQSQIIHYQTNNLIFFVHNQLFLRTCSKIKNIK
eukprot:TRINITY_DN907_c0_g1_i3.p4 TRINITY_DN907_c0_g1~~TRINITY_DN907_c0_g1_i3.p4  ORF type:complete len:109 (-),score=9.25 TRINITY_DN907_c0_g1_i3:385-711(-)